MKEVSLMTIDMVPGLTARLSGIEAMLAQILEFLAAPKVAREWFTVEEVAAMLNKTPYTVREWCREGRINATKRPERRGGAELWNISAAEVERYRNAGLLPPGPYRNASR
jgi:excisionase family DNA binding protein